MVKSKYLVMGLLISVNAFAAPKKKDLEQELRFVPVPELPAKAVALIRAAAPAERGEVASTVVRTIVAKHPAAAPTVVAAITRATPEVSSVAARTAIAVAPETRANVTSAAAANGQSGASDTPTAVRPASPSNAGGPGGPEARSEPAVTRQNAGGQGQTTEPGVGSPPNPNRPPGGVVIITPGPIKYHKPLPNPPRRPVNPPVAKGLNEGRTR